MSGIEYMKWYNTELEPNEAEGFRAFLRENKIKYEASQAGNLIHFECLMDECDKFFADNFLRDFEKLEAIA